MLTSRGGSASALAAVINGDVVLFCLFDSWFRLRWLERLCCPRQVSRSSGKSKGATDGAHGCGNGESVVFNSTDEGMSCGNRIMRLVVVSNVTDSAWVQIYSPSKAYIDTKLESSATRAV